MEIKVTMIKPFTEKVWKRETEELMCTLTEEEFKLRSSSLALCIREIASLKQEDKRLKERIKTKEDEHGKLVDAVQYKQEKREVPLELIPDFEHGTVSSYRLDTMEFHERRMMTNNERQPELDLDIKDDAKDLDCLEFASTDESNTTPPETERPPVTVSSLPPFTGRAYLVRSGMDTILVKVSQINETMYAVVDDDSGEEQWTVHFPPNKDPEVLQKHLDQKAIEWGLEEAKETSATPVEESEKPAPVDADISPFHGATYAYPTANDGEQEIGVVQLLDGNWCVGWVDADEGVHRIKSSNLPLKAFPAELQTILDGWAKDRKLKVVTPEENYDDDDQDPTLKDAAKNILK
jgi:hypothetical protein